MQGESGRAQPRRRALGEGAAQAAPTAPHATPRTERRTPNGPERFWARWPVRIALALCLGISGVIHCSMVPLDMPHRFELNDVEGVADIPVDVFAAEDLQPPPPAASPPAPEIPNDEKDKGSAAPVGHADAATPRDGGIRDAQGDFEVDAVGIALPVDAVGIARPDAAATDGNADSVADAMADWAAAVDGAEITLAGDAAGPVGPHDPEAIVGAVGSVQADATLVMLVVNAEVIRGHPVGSRMGYLLRGIPQWDEFMNGTDINPIRDTDWVMISGPSLVNTSRDVVLIHYAASDAVVDHAVDIVSHKYGRGGRWDAGIPGMKASLAHADRADRVIFRVQSHVLAVVPPVIAEKMARKLVTARVPAHIRPGEAMYLRLVDPHHPIPEIPDSITEIRMRVIPSTDGGAEVLIDGDTKDPDAAAQAAEGIRRMVRRHNDALTSLLTHGLLDHVDVTNSGSLVKVHVAVTRDQIETLVALVGDFLGVQPEVPVPTGSPPPRLASPPKPRQSR